MNSLKETLADIALAVAIGVGLAVVLVDWSVMP